MKRLLVFLVSSFTTVFIGYKIGYSRGKKANEGLANDEVASVKKALEDHYEKKLRLLTEGALIKKDENKPLDTPPTETKVAKGTKVIVKGSNVDYGKPYRSESEQDRIPGNPGNEIKNLTKEEVDTTKPYIITAEEFNDSENDCQTLFYSKDKVLTDDDYNQISNVGIVGGYVLLDQMGKYDADCLYVRDEAKGIDYEILLEQRTFDKLRPLGVTDED